MEYFSAKKKILINASNLKVGGGVQVAVSVISSLLEDSRGLNLFFVISSKVFLQLPEKYRSYKNIVVCDLAPSNISSLLEARRLLFAFEKNYEIDLVFTIFGPGFWKPKLAKHLVGFANAWIVSLDSKAYCIYPIWKRALVKIKNIILGFLLYDKSQHYVTETVDMQVRFCKTFNADEMQIDVVPNSASPEFYKREKDRNPELDSIKDKFKFLTVSHNYPHKNLLTIEKVGELLDAAGYRFIFVVTIPHRDYESLSSAFKKFTHNLGPVTITECPGVYNSCDALYLPSLIECFTVSYLEAMVSKKPILTSDLAFAHSICGDAAFYFDPYDESDIYSTICQLLDSLTGDNKKLKSKLEMYHDTINYFGDNEKRVNLYVNIIKKLLKEL